MTTRYCSRCLTTFTGDPETCSNLGCGANRPSSGWGALLSPGDLLDRHYLVEKVLAIGGAGLTYLAREVDTTGEPVDPLLAIKVLYTQRDSGSFLRRLANEAQILQELNHPYIVECRGFVHRQGHAPYLVTLFETGGTVADLVLGSGPLSVMAACGVLKQLLMALDTAHQRGVIHRDLKPENLLVHETDDASEIPEIRVADFGIAKMGGSLGAALTRHGTFVGTPEFAAPEQFERGELSPATDIFAAGSVLLFLLTGRVPWSFSNRNDVEQCGVELNAWLPPRLDQGHWSDDEQVVLQEVLCGMMERTPTVRWTIQQVIAAIQPLLDGESQLRGSFTDRGASPRAYRAPASAALQSTFDAKNTLAGDGRSTLSNWPESEPPAPAPVASAEPQGGSETEWIRREVPGDAEGSSEGPGRNWMVFGAITALLGAVLVVGVAGGLAFWASSTPSTVTEINLDESRYRSEREEVLVILERATRDASHLCGGDGTVRLSMQIASEGSVRSVDVDPGWASADTRTCMEGALRAVPFSSSSAAVRSLSVAIELHDSP